MSARQQVTRHAPADERPDGYPADFPFIPNVDVWLTQSTDGDEPTGARWLCMEGEVDRVLRELEVHSRAAGWESSSPPPDWPHELHSKLLRGITYMRRGAELRMLITAEADGQWIVQLLDSPWSVRRT